MEAEQLARKAILASRIGLLFRFCTDIIPDLDILKDTVEVTGDGKSMAMAAAPVFSALGQDYEKAANGWDRKRRRAAALYNLIKVLDDTEKEKQAELEDAAKLDNIKQEFIKNVM
jgi:hypothetical protein